MILRLIAAMVFVAALIVGTGHQLVDNGLIEGPAPNSLRVSVDKLKDALETSIDAVDFEYETVARTNEESEAIDRHVAQDRLDRLADGLETEESTANPELADEHFSFTPPEGVEIMPYN